MTEQTTQQIQYQVLSEDNTRYFDGNNAEHQAIDYFNGLPAPPRDWYQVRRFNGWAYVFRITTDDKGERKELIRDNIPGIIKERYSSGSTHRMILRMHITGNSAHIITKLIRQARKDFAELRNTDIQCIFYEDGTQGIEYQYPGKPDPILGREYRPVSSLKKHMQYLDLSRILPSDVWSLKVPMTTDQKIDQQIITMLRKGLKVTPQTVQKSMKFKAPMSQIRAIIELREREVNLHNKRVDQRSPLNRKRKTA